jgi:hypothetical protein
MNLKNKLLGASVAVLMLTGCSHYVPGGLFTMHSVPQSVGTGTGGAKEGEACAMTILGLIGIGDASITAAKSNGGIKTVSHVDSKNMGILGYVFANTCTRVTGD